jgi:hypothetical protein|tara:strand:+ start:131 stop:295 length:165 start_codon:yes stop_codon:yes gene_type:complete
MARNTNVMAMTSNNLNPRSNPCFLEQIKKVTEAGMVKIAINNHKNRSNQAKCIK